MNAPLATPLRFDLQGLVDAIATAPADDSLNNPLTAAQWDALAGYLQPCTLAQGQVLFAQGTQDRTMYFVENGSLSVHMEDAKGRLRLALVGPGSIVGEGAFFSHQPRSATVQAAAACKLWGITPLRFAELSNRQPAVALGLAMGAGAVLAKRLGNRRRRVAAT
ncbi:cyclic nucleotide-binding domain-containing protein [Ramlibacter sp. H39-3-26]|uniref:Crp/Fnr family transcriptional regulator n=1 Tax=Curvibacter soli TaxID=3031331 RepID=UPI0023DBE3E2|nr:cyclic nucleotide-binding domain-containing protein [Ramlibacter sp. H39-3-26]MDF1486321.1 cyclic nucleotide-binding domain-containing protein [Ramlibacter sp. H39-3-26]